MPSEVKEAHGRGHVRITRTLSTYFEDRKGHSLLPIRVIFSQLAISQI